MEPVDSNNLFFIQNAQNEELDVADFVQYKQTEEYINYAADILNENMTNENNSNQNNIIS